MGNMASPTDQDQLRIDAEVEMKAIEEGCKERLITVSSSYDSGDSSTAPGGHSLSIQTRIQQETAGADQAWIERTVMIGAILAWYLVGVVAIVTTKLLLSTWSVPPLLLTFQQLLAASCVLRIVISFRKGGPQPFPWDNEHLSVNNGSKEGGARWQDHGSFIFAGLFNALDFLASNMAFNAAAASFVEAIKSSDPITTTAIALLWKVDTLGGEEAASLTLLVGGVVLSTYGNSQGTSDGSDDSSTLAESISAACIVTVANLCFGFRAMNQKRYLAEVGQHRLDDLNLLCRMQQVGAAALFLPALALNAAFLGECMQQPGDVQMAYLALALANAVSYATYK